MPTATRTPPTPPTPPSAAATTGPPSSASPPIATQSPGTALGSIVYEGPIPGGAGIRIVGTDGTDDHWLFPDVKLPNNGWQVHPDFDRAGLRIAFAADDPADPPGAEVTRDLWVGNADGSNASRVLDCETPCLEAEDPAWSPDGRTLAFVTWGPKPASLALLDLASGSVKSILTVDRAPDGYRLPRWSPDGHRIVLEHQTWSSDGPDGVIVDTTIGIVELDTSAPRFTPLTKPAMWATYPDWHPTEDRIVFSTRPWTELPDGPSRLYTVRPDGSDLAPLTAADAAFRAVQPSWTPDGRSVVFTRVTGTGFGDPAMAMVLADGTGLEPATGASWLFGTHPRIRPTATTP
jgi:Tol biopolymer transport system component